MRNDQYSGLPKFFPEDSAVLTSSGIIRDRSCEALVPADAAISRLYRTLLGIARKSQRGEEPIGLSSDPMLVRGLHGIVEDGKSWQSLVPSHLVKNEPIATAISR